LEQNILILHAVNYVDVMILVVFITNNMDNEHETIK
jgi:hypothetical protein